MGDAPLANAAAVGGWLNRCLFVGHTKTEFLWEFIVIVKIQIHSIVSVSPDFNHQQLH
jgi:hypothetical protein